MRALPKIALARLKERPEAVKTTDGSAGFQGAEHPDANLLAAFVEKTLTEKERAQMLNHLAQCADCREVAAFTLPAEVAMAEPAHGAAGRRWNPWPALRWGAMAAVLGILTIVVVLHPGMWKRPSEISKVMPPPAPAGNVTSAPPTAAPAPTSPPAAETAQAKAQVEDRESAVELAAGKASERERDMSGNNNEARAKAKKQVTMLAASRPAATLRAANVPAGEAEADISKEEYATGAGVLSPPSSSPLLTPAPTAAPEKATKTNSDSRAGQPTIRPVTHSVQVTAANPGTSVGGPSAASDTARETTETTVHAMAVAPMVTMPLSRREMGSGAGLLAALWSVSPNGKVQRSTDGGRTFERINIAPSIIFRAIAALDKEVWAGGTGGALFHSVDGGATWDRAAVTVEGSAVTETITGIKLHDPKHLTITTASGAEWTSEDGGQQWQKQP